MTRKDYIRFAEALKLSYPDIGYGDEAQYYYRYGYESAIEVICDVFKQDNPNFNKDKFLDAVKDD